MAEDIAAVRLRLAEIIARAEEDEEFHQRLTADPAGVLSEHNIPDGAVDEYSQALLEQRAVPVEDVEGEFVCIHTKGCADFTCIITRCGPTCYITIVIDAPDA
jgi:hypothetical protein